MEAEEEETGGGKEKAIKEKKEEKEMERVKEALPREKDKRGKRNTEPPEGRGTTTTMRTRRSEER